MEGAGIAMMNRIAEKVRTRKISGVASEVDSFFASEKEGEIVAGYEVHVDDAVYRIDVYMDFPDSDRVRNICLSFANFMSYRYFTSYCMKEDADGVVFDYITSTEDNSLAFRCIITFFRP